MRKDDDEEIEPRTFTLAEARALVERGEIVDLKTLAGLALVGAAGHVSWHAGRANSA